jgi:hypothetical protein
MIMYTGSASIHNTHHHLARWMNTRASRGLRIVQLELLRSLQRLYYEKHGSTIENRNEQFPSEDGRST